MAILKHWKITFTIRFVTIAPPPDLKSLLRHSGYKKYTYKNFTEWTSFLKTPIYVQNPRKKMVSNQISQNWCTIGAKIAKNFVIDGILMENVFYTNLMPNVDVILFKKYQNLGIKNLSLQKINIKINMTNL